MAKRGSNLGERNKDEPAFQHTRVGNLKLGRVERFVAVEQDVEINDARSLGDGFAAAHAGFDGTQRVE